ncbi:hypothetical protein [Helicobacter pullorum]
MAIIITNADNNLIDILKSTNKKLSKPYKIEKFQEDFIPYQESYAYKKYQSFSEDYKKELAEEIKADIKRL